LGRCQGAYYSWYTHTSNNASDQLELKPTLEDAEKMCGSLDGMQAGADAGYFSAGNIRFMEEKGIDFYTSYPVAKTHSLKTSLCMTHRPIHIDVRKGTR